MSDDKNRIQTAEEEPEVFEIGEDATVTLDLDDGTTLECSVITIYSALGKEYIALLPLDESGQSEDGEVYLYRFSLRDGQPQLDNIEDDDEFEAASEGFDEWLDSQEYDELVWSDEEEDD